MNHNKIQKLASLLGIFLMLMSIIAPLASILIFPQKAKAVQGANTLLVTDKKDIPSLPVITVNSFGAMKVYLLKHSDSD